MKAKLAEIAEQLELRFDEMSLFYNAEDGKVYPISDEDMRAAEECDDLDSCPEWEQETIRTAWRALNEDCFFSLPSEYDVHEYQIMEDFCYSVQDRKTADELQFAIRGRGAFRMFKHTCRRYGIMEDWHAYKAEALKGIAKSWCIDNDLEYEE